VSSVATTEAASELGGRTLVVGLGNPILGDDGVGWRVVDALEGRIAGDARALAAAGSVELDRDAIGGLGLMERMVGFAQAILVDALVDDGTRPGQVTTFALAAAPDGAARHLDSAHDVRLSDALAVGRSLEAPLPRSVDVVGIGVERVHEFDDRLTPPVAAAVGKAVDLVLTLLRRPAEGA
jgi:hydrogenase maturation protease